MLCKYTKRICQVYEYRLVVEDSLYLSVGLSLIRAIVKIVVL